MRLLAARGLQLGGRLVSTSAGVEELKPSTTFQVTMQHPIDETATNHMGIHEISDVSDSQLVTAIARYSEFALAEAYRRNGGAVFGLARASRGLRLHRAGQGGGTVETSVDSLT
jgi:hypothetical protein